MENNLGNYLGIKDPKFELHFNNLTYMQVGNWSMVRNHIDNTTIYNPKMNTQGVASSLKVPIILPPYNDLQEYDYRIVLLIQYKDHVVYAEEVRADYNLNGQKKPGAMYIRHIHYHDPVPVNKFRNANSAITQYRNLSSGEFALCSDIYNILLPDGTKADYIHWSNHTSKLLNYLDAR